MSGSPRNHPASGAPAPRRSLVGHAAGRPASGARAPRRPPGSRAAGGPRAHAHRPAPALWLPLLGLALLVSVVLSLGLGSAEVGLAAAARAIREGLQGRANSPEASIVLRIRLPRAVLAVLVGVLLSVSGAVMQGFFRNAMADPYLVGVSSGAALGAVLAMLLGWGFSFGAFSAVPLAAFVFALGTVALVYALNRRHGRLHAEGLLLSGIALAAAISAVVSLLLVMSRNAIQQVLFWLMGSLASARWDHVEIVLPYAVLGLAVVWYLARDLDLLLWGDTTGAALGVNVERSRTILLVASSLMTAAAVAVCGIVGFVGLLMPHIARFLVGPVHRRLLPAAALMGGTLLLWADIVARTVWAPVELPLGAITAIVGAPFLVYLVLRRQSGGISLRP
jgi:iron complex transport system permease protein